MKVEEYVGKRNINITELAKEIDYSRAYVNRVLSGLAKPGKKIGKALEKASNGQITYEDLLMAHKARHKNK